jgi:hypothetical protein
MRELYEHSQEAKNDHVNAVGMNNTMKTKDKTPHMNEASQVMRQLSPGYIQITESIIAHWVEAAAEIEDHWANVQNNTAPISNGPTQG